MKRPHPKSAADIVRRWPSAEAFGVDLGLKRRGDHARVMMVRGRIPRSYWPRVLDCAHQRGIELTEADLEAAHRRRRGERVRKFIKAHQASLANAERSA